MITEDAPNLKMDACIALRIFACFCMFHVASGGNPFVGEELYVGCYRRFQAGLNVDLPLKECIIKCTYKHFYFAAVKDLSGCYCGNKISQRVPSSRCKKTQFYFVYTVVPTYMGCFKDSANRDLDLVSRTGLQSLTIQQCNEECTSKEALFSGTQYSESCFCGNHFGKHGSSSDTECNKPCTGDSSQICGSNWRNSVYSANHIPGLSMTFDKVFHCITGSDMFGYCKRHKCAPGWKGDKCEQRNCQVSNGNCGGHKCVEFQVRGVSISECLCNKGFASLSTYHECKDVDECTTQNCFNEGDLCVNTFGSHVCSHYKEQDLPDY